MRLTGSYEPVSFLLNSFITTIRLGVNFKPLLNGDSRILTGIQNNFSKLKILNAVVYINPYYFTQVLN